MEDFDSRLHDLNRNVPHRDPAVSFTAILAKTAHPEEAKAPFLQVKNMAVIAIILIVTNVSAVLWFSSKDQPVTKTNQTAGYMQTYNLSIY